MSDRLNFKITHILEDGCEKPCDLYLIEIFSNLYNCNIFNFSINKNGIVKSTQLPEDNGLNKIKQKTKILETIKYIIKNKILNHIYKEYNLTKLFIYVDYAYQRKDWLEILEYIGIEKERIKSSQILLNKLNFAENYFIYDLRLKTIVKE